MTTFKELGISNTLINALDKINIKTPSITQIKCITEAKLGYSIILQSRSGTGKTISFCIYLLDTLIHVPYEVIIIVPTRELAVQINILLNSIDPGLSISLNIGGNDINNMECQDSPVIIATPGRFQTLIKQNTKKFKSNPGFCFWSNTRLLIFDEVDMLLDDHFYGQLNLICNKIVNPSMQIIATSATFMKPQFQKFEDLIEEIDKSYKSDSEVYKFQNKMDNLGLKSSFNEDSALCKGERIFKRIILTSSYINRMTSESQLNTLSIGNVYNDTNRVQSYQFIESDLSVTDSLYSKDEPSVLDGNLEFYMVQILDAPNIIMQIGLKIRCILAILHSINYKKCIIFCNQSHSRLQLYRFLQYFGFPCILNSARSSNKDRINISQLPDINNLVIICTDVMCRGIDVSNVDVVIKMDLPSTKENFLHRSGRTGRFGKSGKCITICAVSEVDTFRYFLYVLNFKLSPIEKLSKDLNIDENGVWNYIGKDEIILEPKLSIMNHFIYPYSGIKNNFNVNYQDSHDNLKENNTNELVTFYSNTNLTVIESLLEGNTYDLKYNHINYWKQLIIS